MASLRMRITGMTCGHCVSTVEEALNGVEGAIAVFVELPDVAEVDYAEEKATAEQLVEAVTDKGYGAEVVD